LYVPMDADADIAFARKQYIKKVLDEQNPQGKLLLTAWKDNSPFILAHIEEKVEDLFFTDSKSDLKQPPYLDDLDLLGPFADMHKFWQNSDSKSS
jgi:hypothetical protein